MFYSTLAIGTSYLVALPLTTALNKTYTKHSESHEEKELQGTLAQAAGVATTILISTLVVPTVTKYISDYQVSYIEAALYGLVGGALFTQLSASDSYPDMMDFVGRKTGDFLTTLGVDLGGME